MIVAVLAAFATWVLLARVARPTRTARSVAPRQDAGVLRRLRPLLAGLCVVGGWTLLGGFVGVAAGVLGAWFAWRALARAETPDQRRRREQLSADLPLGIHLLAATLRSGAAVSVALEVVAAAVRGPVGEEFRLLQARLDLGADPATVWSAVAADGPLVPLGRTMLRAYRSGSSVAGAVDQLSADLRAARRDAVLARARTVEVKAAAPLGVCLLPAFLLLGVVPLAAGLFSSLELLH